MDIGKAATYAGPPAVVDQFARYLLVYLITCYLKGTKKFSAQRCRKLVITERLERTIPVDITVVENQRKTLILHCERSELRLHFEWTKISGK